MSADNVGLCVADLTRLWAVSNILKATCRRLGYIMRKSQLEAIALTEMIEGKELEVDKGKRLWTGIRFFAYGEQRKINDILKICQDRN